MAEKRMFAKTIVFSDAFLDMPCSARNLYFSLNMVADDDGFVNQPKTVMRMVGASQDDLTILIARKFILPFESGVVVIKHWRIHNYIQKDRYIETKYKEEKSSLAFDENKAYTLSKNDLDTECVQPVSILETQYRVRLDTDIDIDKDTILSDLPSDDSISIDDVFERTYAVYPRKEHKVKGKVPYILYLTKGKVITGQKRLRFNHQQIFFAVQAYADEMQGKEKQYVQVFSTFMNSTVVDYIEQTQEAYEAWMFEKYGNDWKGVKFTYH